MSQKWPILCWVGRKTLNQWNSTCCFPVTTVWCDRGIHSAECPLVVAVSVFQPRRPWSVPTPMLFVQWRQLKQQNQRWRSFTSACSHLFYVNTVWCLKHFILLLLVWFMYTQNWVNFGPACWLHMAYGIAEVKCVLSTAICVCVSCLSLATFPHYCTPM